MINTASSSGLDNPAINQIENAESNLFNLIEHGSSESGFTSIKTAVKSSIEHIDICIKKGDKTTGISCGLIDLDDIIHGFHNSDLVILAARPGMGKTTLMLNFTYEAGAHFLIPEGADKSEQKSVGIFSLEMQSEQLATKLISMQSSVSSSALMSGRIKEEEYNRLKSVQNSLIELPIYIDDTAALSISSIRTRARRLKRKHNLGILFIDYLQLIQPSRNMQNRVLEITEITQGLKALAKELNIPIVALSQLSREVEKRADKRPLLSDLRESGSIEQDADIVMFIYRDEYYDSMRSQQQVEQDNTNSVQSRVQAYTEETRKSKFEINKNRAEVIVAKHRKGRTGVAEIYFNAELSKFDNLNKTYEENT
jgi:replicative DNA helicase